MKQATITFLLGSFGGVIAYAFSFPIPWLLGGLVAVFVGHKLNIKLAEPHKVFSRWIRVLIGVALGASVASSLNQFNPSIFLAILLSFVFVVILTTFGTWYFRRLEGFQTVDSFMSALPGGLSFLIALAGDLGDRFPKIALIHTVRIVVLVFSFSVMAMYLGVDDIQEVKGNPFSFVLHFDLLKILVLILCTGFLADRVKVTGSHVIMGLILSAIFYKFGLIQQAMPELLITLAMIYLGALLGYELANSTPKGYFKLMSSSLVYTFVALVTALLISLVIGRFLHDDFLLYLLALAPGGIAEISLITLALGLDAGFVAIVHACRFVFILIAGPIGLNILIRKSEEE